jgi:hypothetical protein
MEAPPDHTPEPAPPPLPFQTATAPPPPVPGGAAASAAGEPAWAIRRESWAFDATRWQIPPVPYVVRRSAWRTGVVAVGAEGVVIDGPAADPHGTFTRYANWLSWAWMAVWFLPWGTRLLGGAAHMPFSAFLFRMALGGFALLASIVLSLLAEYRRVSWRSELPWERVETVQFDRTGQVATLVYAVPPAKPGRPPVRLALPMRLAGRGEAAELRAEIARHAPDRVSDAHPRNYWSRGRTITAAVLVALIAGVLAWLVLTASR